MISFEKPEIISKKGEKQEKPETELEKFVFEKLEELNFSNGLADKAKDFIGAMKTHSEYTYKEITVLYK